MSNKKQSKLNKIERDRILSLKKMMLRGYLRTMDSIIEYRDTKVDVICCEEYEDISLDDMNLGEFSRWVSSNIDRLSSGRKDVF